MLSGMEASLVSASLNGAPPKVTLGGHEYTAYAQRHAYLSNRLGKAVAQLQNMENLGSEGIEGVVASLGEQAYDFLAVFYPKMMPKWEFAGYPTLEALEAGDYQEDYDKSPSIPEIVTAFEVALRVNRLDSLKSLGKLINMDLIRAYMSAGMVNLIERQRSSSEGDTSDLMSSGMTPPTATPSVD